MYRKLSRFLTHLLTAVGMLAVLLIVMFYVFKFGSNLPVVGGLAASAGQHASGAAEGF